jgi:hypothetical protein
VKRGKGVSGLERMPSQSQVLDIKKPQGFRRFWGVVDLLRLQIQTFQKELSSRAEFGLQEPGDGR